MSLYTGKRFVDPLNKNFGRRTGRDFRAGKNIRVGKDGFENFDDYFSESDADVTKEFPRRHASTIREESESAGSQESVSEEEYKENQPSQGTRVSQSMPNATSNNVTSSQSLSQISQQSKFGWLRNRDIGRRTGRNITANKEIRVDEQGFENFDDYFSESDMSSVSSRLSVSVVKPVPRRSAISSLVLDDIAPPVCSQESQMNSTEGEDGSHDDEDKNFEKDDSEDSEKRSTGSDSDTHHTNTHSEEEETFTAGKNGTHSVHEKSDMSGSKWSGKKQQSRDLGEYSEDSVEDDGNGNLGEDSVGDDGNEVTEHSDTSVGQMSQSDAVSQYIDTPLSSRRSRSHINATSEKYDDTETSDIKTKDGNINNLSRHTGRQHKSGTQKNHSGVDEPDYISNNIEISKHSEGNETESDSEEEESEMEDKGKDQLEVEQVDYSEDNEMNNDENDAVEADSEDNDEAGEQDVSDVEVHSDSNEKQSKNSAQSSHKGVNKRDISHQKDAPLKSRADSRDVEEEQETETDNNRQSETGEDDFDDDYEDSSETRPSQTQTNIDVAGNRSGSITKLDIPTSVVSFNRTRKRLSYSAGEASEESLKRNRSRIEKANAELSMKDDITTPKAVTSHIQAIPNNETKPSGNVSSKTVKGNSAVQEDGSEFLSLASRSTLPQVTNIRDEEDDDDDILVLDYDRSKITAVNRKKAADGKTKKTGKKSDSESQSDSDKTQKRKNIKQGSKSEVKKQKLKDNTKDRRKTTHGSNKVNGLTVDLDFKKQKYVNKSKSHSSVNSNNDVNFTENFNNDTSAHRISKNEDANVSDIRDNGAASDKTVDKSRTKKGPKQNKRSDKKLKSNQKNRNEDKHTALKLDHEIENNEAGFENFEDLDIEKQEEDNIKETGSLKEEQKAKEISKRTIKRNSPQTDSDSSQHVGIKSQKRKSTRKSKQNINDSLGNGDDNNMEDSDSDEIEIKRGKRKVKKKSAKKQNRQTVLVDDPTKDIRENESSHEDEQVIEIVPDKALKRKSSSDEGTADNVKTNFKSKKPKQSKENFRSRSKRNAKQKRGKHSAKDHDDVFDSEVVSPKPDLGELGKKTPTVDSRVSVPTQFGSGVSFRVSRRSEVLEDVGSGYIGEVTVQTENTGGLTPCISRPGAARKSKGRRVTICPEENVQHDISGNKSPDDNFRKFSFGTSGNATPLPDPDSTPVHYCETTLTGTPHPGKAEESIIKDRLIKPSPPEPGLRRSQRTRLKPIAWYKNERIVFDYRRRSGPAIVGVKPSLEATWGKVEEEKRRKRMLRYQIRKAMKKEDKPYRKLSIHQVLPADVEIEDSQDMEVTVYNQNLQAEDGIDCIGKRDAFRPVGPTHATPKREDPYVITKLLDHPCMSAGKLHIKPNAEKPEQLVNGDYILFFIEYGKVLVKLHKTSFLVETGDTFMVPIGNTYSISNLRDDTAKLFYTIHKRPEYSSTDLSSRKQQNMCLSGD